MMRNNSKPVKSATAVAALRAASVNESVESLANPDYLARYFVRGAYSLILALPKRVSRWLIEWISPGSYCYFLARTHFFDFHFQEAISKNIKQIVILGAGYDTRANRLLDKSNDVTVFEIDLPETQSDKLQKMRDASIPLKSNVVYIPHNFNEGSLKKVLLENGFNLEKPAFFLFEGVSYYLEEKSVNELFQFIRNTCSNNSSIAFDYSTKSFVQGMENTYGAKKMQKWLIRNNERFQFGVEEGELGDYLQALGLNPTEDIGYKEVIPRYLKGKNGFLIGKPLGHLRLAHAIHDSDSLLI